MHNFNSHKEKCKEKQTFTCKTCSKKLDNWYNFNLHETKYKKRYDKTKITYECNICSKVLDNKTNLLQHEKACRKHQKATKHKEKKKRDNHKYTLES